MQNRITFKYTKRWETKGNTADGDVGRIEKRGGNKTHGESGGSGANKTEENDSP